MLRFLEISWLCVTLAGLGFAAYKTITDSVASAVYVLFFTLIAFVFYLVRRNQRRKMDRQHNMD